MVWSHKTFLLSLACVAGWTCKSSPPQARPGRTYRMGFAISAPGPYYGTNIYQCFQHMDAAIINTEVPWDSLLGGESPEDYVIHNYASYVQYSRQQDWEVWVHRPGERTEPGFGFKSARSHGGKHRRAFHPERLSPLRLEVAWGKLGGSAYVGVDQDFTDFPFIQELGLSSYPYISFGSPSDLPADYYSKLVTGHPVLCFGGRLDFGLGSGGRTNHSKQPVDTGHLYRAPIPTPCPGRRDRRFSAGLYLPGHSRMAAFARAGPGPFRLHRHGRHRV